MKYNADPQSDSQKSLKCDLTFPLTLTCPCLMMINYKLKATQIHMNPVMFIQQYLKWT